eukprot:20617-Heterococcus_DN1.PRE.1
MAMCYYDRNSSALQLAKNASASCSSNRTCCSLAPIHNACSNKQRAIGHLSAKQSTADANRRVYALATTVITKDRKLTASTTLV